MSSRRLLSLESLGAQSQSVLLNYLNELETIVKQKGGECELSFLGSNVIKRPKDWGSLKKLLEKYPDRFVTETKENGNETWVRLKQIQKDLHEEDVQSQSKLVNYLNKLETIVKRKGGECRIDFLGNIKRPKDWGSLKKLLEEYPDRFVTETKKGSEAWVRLKQIQKDLHVEDLIYHPSPLNDNVPADDTVSNEKVQIQYVQTRDHLECIASKLNILCQDDAKEEFIAFDCEGLPENISLLQIATNDCVYVFDCFCLEPSDVCSALSQVFSNPNIIKMSHDLHGNVDALIKIGNLRTLLRGFFDSQLAYEMSTESPVGDFNLMLEHFASTTPTPTKKKIITAMRRDQNFWKNRPLSKDAIQYAALDVHLLLAAKPMIFDALGSESVAQVLDASRLRVDFTVESGNGSTRSMCFDSKRRYLKRSKELLQTTCPDDMLSAEPLQLENEITELFQLLPEDLKTKLINTRDEKPTTTVTKELTDIVLDFGRRPWCTLGSKRIMLSDDSSRVLTRDEIDGIVAKVGGFGHDKRAGLDQQLHRISGMLDRDGVVNGLTLRTGRWVRGNANMLMDVLLGSDKSILILGPPGAGKTSIVREATRILSEESNVVVVDTSNEIAGDGRIPHKCIGSARRMMIDSLDKQASVMIECVQNHTPDCIVIDEIGRLQESRAARTVKMRGVRIVASAHGDLRTLISNKELCGLVGDIENVILGDKSAEKDARRRADYNAAGSVSKVKRQRIHEPTFDCVVEVTKAARNEWRVITDVTRAVDDVLEGSEYEFERRLRNPNTGQLSCQFGSG